MHHLKSQPEFSPKFWLKLFETEIRLFKENILSAVTSYSLLNDDYLGALQIFQIAKLSKSEKPTDDDKDFWCPMFESDEIITPIKLGFETNLTTLI